MTWWSLSLIVESWIYLSIQHHLHFLQMLWQCTWFIDIYLGQLSSLVITFNERSSCWPRMMFECNARSTQVLSIHKALSIQAHPDKTRAAKLHADASPNFELGRLDIGRLTAWSWDKRSLSQDREQSVYICTYKVNQLYMYNCVYIYTSCNMSHQFEQFKECKTSMKSSSHFSQRVTKIRPQAIMECLSKETSWTGAIFMLHPRSFLFGIIWYLGIKWKSISTFGT